MSSTGLKTALSKYFLLFKQKSKGETTLQDSDTPVPRIVLRYSEPYSGSHWGLYSSTRDCTPGRTETYFGREYGPE
jgi:hypothetical protein